MLASIEVVQAVRSSGAAGGLRGASAGVNESARVNVAMRDDVTKWNDGLGNARIEIR